MQKEIKCAALDLDGTVLQKDGRMSERTRLALKKAAENRIEIVVVSGRSFATIPEEIRHLEQIRYIVTSNGAAVYEKGARIHDWTLEEQSVEKVLDLTGHLFQQGRITYEIFVKGEAYGQKDYLNAPERYGLPEHSCVYVKNTRRPTEDIVEFALEHKRELDSINLIVADPELYKKLRQLLEYDKKIYITSAASYRMEISHRDSGKISGLGYVLKRLGILPEETIAFGDGDNDAAMLKWVGVGVAMDNGTRMCREAADLVTVSSSEDGVARILEQICAKE